MRIVVLPKNLIQKGLIDRMFGLSSQQLIRIIFVLLVLGILAYLLYLWINEQRQQKSETGKRKDKDLHPKGPPPELGMGADEPPSTV
jgi:hypothetical protein